jgi:hypothetical protein
MKKKLFSVTFWLVVFFSIVALEGYSAIAQDAGDIVGKWSSGSVGLLQYKNQVTGATKSNRGSVFWYKFLPNGTYEFVGYMEITVYNCTSGYYNEIKGRYTVDGTTLNLSPARDYWKSTNSCAPSATKEVLKTPTKTSMDFKLGTDDYGKQQICLITESGESCYRRDEQ